MELFKTMDKSVKIVLGLLIGIILAAGLYSQRHLWMKESSAAEVKKIQSYLNQQLERINFSGSVLVEYKGKILVKQGYGMANYELNVPNTPQTKFDIGSVSKTFTAVAVMQLAEKNKIRLEDTIDKYIPGYPSGEKIHISDILSHKSGIPDFTDSETFMDTMRLYKTPDELIEEFKDKPLEFEPGTKFQYSNSGYVLLAYIIEKVTNDTYEAYLKENIFKPLGMKDTEIPDAKRVVENRASGYSVNNKVIVNCDMADKSLEFGGSGIYSTVEDLYKWNKAMYSTKILKKESWKKMLTPYSDFYGYGWLIGEMSFDKVKKKVVGHNGMYFGYSSVFLEYPEDKLVVIVLSNFENFRQGSLADQVGYDLAGIVTGNYKP